MYPADLYSFRRCEHKRYLFNCNKAQVEAKAALFR